MAGTGDGDAVAARLAVQLYSLRHLPTLAEQLALVRAAGLALVETSSAHYADTDATRRLIDEAGLAAPSGHVGIGLLRDPARAADLARRMGNRQLVLWGLPEDERPSTAEGWREAGAALGETARALSDHGIALAFHNHDWELAPLAGRTLPLDALFAGAEGSPLGWQPDVAWIARAGVDVAALLRRHASLIASVHLKDVVAPGTGLDEDGWADLGHGILDWTSLWPVVDDPAPGLLVLEHDEPRDPARFLRRSVAFARALGAFEDRSTRG